MTQIKFRERGSWQKYSLDQFKWLRTTVIRSYCRRIDLYYLPSLIDKLDLVMELKPGESIYFVPSEYGCHIEYNDIELLNKWCNEFDSNSFYGHMSKNYREHYRPQIDYAFCIKRTNKLWKLISLYDHLC